MKCTQCGFEQELDFRFCPTCGAEQPSAAACAAEAVPASIPAVQTDTPVAPILSALKDSLFFLICILVTGNAVLNLGNGGLPVLEILFSVFLWLTYAKAKKDVVDPGHLRCVSGTVYASYVVTNVVAICCIVCGALVFLFAGSAAFGTAFWAELLNELDLAADTEILFLAEEMGGLFLVVFGVIFLLVGVLVLVLNILSTRKIHRFAKSVYQAAQGSTAGLVHAKTAGTWLLVMGILCAISSLGSFSSDITVALAELFDGVASILSYVLIRQYLLPTASAAQS